MRPDRAPGGLTRGKDTSEPAPSATSMAEGPSDAELLRRVRDADEAALSQLYQRFVRPCYSLARRICADEGLAEDVVQEVFLTLWRDPTRRPSTGRIRHLAAHGNPPSGGGRGEKGKRHPSTGRGRAGSRRGLVAHTGTGR